MAERLRTRSMGSGQSAQSKMVVLSITIPANADMVDTYAFIADQRYRVVSVKAAWQNVSTSGVIAVRTCTGTQLPAAGTSMGAFSTSANANAVTEAVLGSEFVLNAGDRIGVSFSGTLTGLDGVNITIGLLPLDGKEYYVSP